jgi:hypothetical protein
MVSTSVNLRTTYAVYCRTSWVSSNTEDLLKQLLLLLFQIDLFMKGATMKVYIGFLEKNILFTVVFLSQQV